MVAGYRRRAWGTHVHGLYAEEGGPVPAGNWPATDDCHLFLVQQDESAEVPNWPSSEPRPEVPERLRARHGAAGRRRNHQRRPPPRRVRPGVDPTVAAAVTHGGGLGMEGLAVDFEVEGVFSAGSGTRLPRPTSTMKRARVFVKGVAVGTLNVCFVHLGYCLLCRWT